MNTEYSFNIARLFVLPVCCGVVFYGFQGITTKPSTLNDDATRVDTVKWLRPSSDMYFRVVVFILQETNFSIGLIRWEPFCWLVTSYGIGATLPLRM